MKVITLYLYLLAFPIMFSSGFEGDETSPHLESPGYDFRCFKSCHVCIITCTLLV